MSYIKIGTKEYKLNVTIKTVLDVQEELDINLMEPMSNDDSPLLVKLASDDLKLANVIYVTIKSQLEREGVSKDEFFESIDGGVMKDLYESFFKAYESFFTHRGREGYAKLIRELLAQIEKTNKQLSDSLNYSEEADSQSTNA